MAANMKRGAKNAAVATIVTRDGTDCYVCGGPMDMNLYGTEDDFAPTIEHIVPTHKGGTNLVENLALSHRWCNGRRNTQDSIVKQSREKLRRKRTANLRP
jgi:5-methylcytosine-specific restriction endonuclease McrA